MIVVYISTDFRNKCVISPQLIIKNSFNLLLTITNQWIPPPFNYVSSTSKFPNRKLKIFGRNKIGIKIFFDFRLSLNCFFFYFVCISLFWTRTLFENAFQFVIQFFLINTFISFSLQYCTPVSTDIYIKIKGFSSIWTVQLKGAVIVKHQIRNILYLVTDLFGFGPKSSVSTANWGLTVLNVKVTAVR